MVRKDSEKDSERPHYYSQFWLDIAAGRKTIGGPRANDEADVIEPELDEPIPLRRPARSSSSHHYEAAIVHPEVEPMEEEEEEFAETTPDDLGMAEDEVDEADIPNILVEEIAPEIVPVEDEVITEPLTEPLAEPLAEAAEEEEEGEEKEEEDFYDEEEEEEEPEGGWPGRGRKKPKGRQTRLPTKKPPKRDRRGPAF